MMVGYRTGSGYSLSLWERVRVRSIATGIKSQLTIAIREVFRKKSPAAELAILLADAP